MSAVAQAEPLVLLSTPVWPGGAGMIRAAPPGQHLGAKAPGENECYQEPWHRRAADQHERDGPAPGNLIVITRTDRSLSCPGQALVQDPVQILVTGLFALAGYGYVLFVTKLGSFRSLPSASPTSWMAGLSTLGFGRVMSARETSSWRSEASYGPAGLVITTASGSIGAKFGFRVIKAAPSEQSTSGRPTRTSEGPKPIRVVTTDHLLGGTREVHAG